MPGSYGNENIYRAASSAYIDYSSTSEAVTLPIGTVAVTVFASSKCWVHLSKPGQSATAVAPSAEKVFVQDTFQINASDRIDIAVDQSTDENQVQLAVIRDAADGTLDIIARKE